MLGEKIIMVTSAPQRVVSSLAFLKMPYLRLEKVTKRLLSLGIFTISNFWRPLLLLDMPANQSEKISWNSMQSGEMNQHL